MEPEYKKIPITQIRPNDYNPNEMPKKVLKELVKEIREKGFLQPILINKDGIIIDGEHRYLAGQEAGINEIPCIIIDIPTNEAKFNTVNLNQIKGNTNPLKMAELIKSLSNDFDLSQIAKDLYLGQSEVESYLELLDLGNFNFEDLGDIEEITNIDINQVTCPQCGHQFEI